MFVENIQNDIEWLGFHWDELHFASDFFEKLYEIACGLIRKGVAYVDDQTSEEMRKNRGTLTKPGVNSPYRDRSVEENLDLFRRMRAGEFPDGSRVLRAKIDMASPNVLMRDPTLYRILRCHHHRTGDAWCIYPMYDFQHPLQDAIEGITHSLCSVSYTHLDVYKRQTVRLSGLTRAMKSAAGVSVSSPSSSLSASGSATSSSRIGSYRRISQGSAACALSPVSYPHLDVYKRQLLLCGAGLLLAYALLRLGGRQCAALVAAAAVFLGAARMTQAVNAQPVVEDRFSVTISGTVADSPFVDAEIDRLTCRLTDVHACLLYTSRCV